MSKTKPPLVSVVVLSWNTLSDTQLAIASIRELDYSNFEIIVVDNGSSDGSKEWLAEQERITYVDLPVNTGFTGGQIAAYKVANGDYIALVNSDAVVAKNWLSILINELEADKNVAIAGGRAYNWREDQKPYDTTNGFYSYQVVDPIKAYGKTLTTGEQKCFVDSISGSGVIIRRKAIDKVGYFDNSYFAYFEETDLFARFKRAGYTVLYVPEAHVWHKIGVSTKGKPYFYFRQMGRNRFRFAVKNFDRKEAFQFFSFYVLDAFRAHYRYLKHKDLDNKARVNTFWWNMVRLPQTLSRRFKVQKVGTTYTQTLRKRILPTDITVIVTCYNYEKFVTEALNSLKKQTVQPYRIVVIDDGSTDNSVEAIKKFGDYVEVVAKENEGVVVAKNLGLSMVETTWVIFFDADDTIEPTYIEELLKHANRTHADVTYTDMEYFGAKTGKMTAGRYGLGRLLEGNFIHNSALIQTDSIKEVGGYKLDMREGYEDWEMYISLAERGAKFAYVPKPIFNYRQKVSSRNLEAEQKAKRLHQTVRQLHAATYRRHSHSLTRIKKIILRIYHNPLLPLIVIINTPLAFLSGIKGFFKSARRSLAYRTRNYLHKRDEERMNEEDEIWLQ